jgi:hypothetical protein
MIMADNGCSLLILPLSHTLSVNWIILRLYDWLMNNHEGAGNEAVHYRVDALILFKSGVHLEK